MTAQFPDAMATELTHWTGVIAALPDNLVAPLLEELNQRWTGMTDPPPVSEGNLAADRSLFAQTLALNALMGSRADEQAGLDDAVAAVRAVAPQCTTLETL